MLPTALTFIRRISVYSLGPRRNDSEMSPANSLHTLMM